MKILLSIYSLSSEEGSGKKEHFDNRIDGNYPQLMRLLEKQGHMKIVFVQNFDKTVFHNYDPDIIYLMESCALRSFFKNVIEICQKFTPGVPIIIFSEDVYKIDHFAKNILMKQIDGLLNTVKISSIIPKLKKACPHLFIQSLDSTFVNTDIFKPYDDVKKEYDIVLYGSFSFNYPFRKRLFSLIKKHNSVQNEFKIDIVPKTRKYQIELNTEPVVYGVELAKRINKAHMSIIAKGKYDIMYKKYLEVAACDTVVCGNIPSDYKNVFQNNIIYIDTYMSDEKIINIIRDALKNKEKLRKMGQHLGKQIRETMNFEIATKNFLKKSQNFIDHFQTKKGLV